MSTGPERSVAVEGLVDDEVLVDLAHHDSGLHSRAPQGPQPRRRCGTEHERDGAVGRQRAQRHTTECTARTARRRPPRRVRRRRRVKRSDLPEHGRAQRVQTDAADVERAAVECLEVEGVALALLDLVAQLEPQTLADLVRSGPGPASRGSGSARSAAIFSSMKP